MATIDATVGGALANSYETHAEANTYFGNRIPITPPWVASGEEAYLITATRLLDNLAQPFKTFFPASGGSPAYYRVRRQWTGLVATPTQRLAWPRIGMFDANGNPLDLVIVGNTVASPTIVSTGSVPHRQQTGASVLIFGDTTSSPSINGTWTVTVIDPYRFSIPQAVTVAGTGARVSWIPSDLKDAESEFGGQLLGGDRSLDNSVIVQGLTSVKAGSVSLNFKQEIMPQVVPDAVFNIMPQSWLTDELYVLANEALFEVVSRGGSVRDGNRGCW